MKKALFAVLATAMFAGVASAQMTMDGAKSASLQLSYFSPAGGDLSDGAEPGLGFGIGYQQALTTEISAVAELDMVAFGEKTTSGAKVTVTSNILGLLGKYAFPETNGLTPYAIGGLNIASVKGEVDAPGVLFDGSETNTRIGIQFGGGVEKVINDSWNFGADLRYRTFGADGSAISLGLRGIYKFGK